MRVRIFIREDGSYGFEETSLFDKDSFEVLDERWEAYKGLQAALALAEKDLLTKACSVGARPL